MERYRVLHSVDQLPDLTGYEGIVIDTETSGLYPWHGDRIAGIALGPVDEDWQVYIPIRHKPGPSFSASMIVGSLDEILCEKSASPSADLWFNLDVQAVFSWLRPYFADPEKLWILHNAVYDLAMFRADGLEIAGRVFDTLSAAHVNVGELNSYGLDVLTACMVPTFKHPWYAKVKQWLEQEQRKCATWSGQTPYNYSHVPSALLGMYACEDIDATRQVNNAVLREILEDPRSYVCAENYGNLSHTRLELLAYEMDLVKVLFEMQDTGVQIDIERAVVLRDKSLGEMEAYHDKMFEICGYAFNVGSWKQMWKAFEDAGGVVFYWMRNSEDRGKQKLDHFTLDKAKSTGRPCWNSAALLKYLKFYQKPGFEKQYNFILYYREAEQRKRLVSTYIDAYLQLVDQRGVLHGSIKAHGTRTGRLSSANPNCQNVAKVKGNADQKAWEQFLYDEDADVPEAVAKQIRSLFITRDPQQVLVSIDYSQIEYRTAAYFSNDPVLLKKYRDDPTTDYHQATSELAGIDRDLAKTVNFGTLYGMGASGLASALTGMGKPTTKDAAANILAELMGKRPALARLIGSTSAQCSRDKYVLNIFGRICDVPMNKSYVGLNYRVQGTCGDLMRRAMLRVYAAMKENHWPIRMLISVHDELLFEMPIDRVEEISLAIVKIMCDAPQMAIPLLCDIEVGDNWAEQAGLREWKKGKQKPEKTLDKTNQSR